MPSLSLRSPAPKDSGPLGPRRMFPNPPDPDATRFDMVDTAFIKSLWRLTFHVGGKHESMSVRDEGTIEWVVDGIHRTGSEGKPMWDVAGVALHRVVREHPFMDCNHRTGWLLCRTLMLVAGYDIAVSRDEAVSFVKSIDALGRNEEEVREWVRRSFFRSS